MQLCFCVALSHEDAKLLVQGAVDGSANKIMILLRDGIGGVSILSFYITCLSRWVVKTLNFYISIIEFVLCRSVSVLPARLRMPLKELFSAWVLYFALLVWEGWLWNLNKKGCLFTLTSKAVIPVILQTAPSGHQDLNKLLCSVWQALSTLLTFFPSV